MSYNDGWQTHPAAEDGTPPGSPLAWGYQGGPGAFDIAAIQAKYGADPGRNAGDTNYILPDKNQGGTFWSTIWDVSGIDTITHLGSASASISLIAATLDYSPTGSGVISYVEGIFGGFTIANGVTIENATGGSGNDTLSGNHAANRLDGGAGNDVIAGFKGNDTLLGRDGADNLHGSDGTDRLYGGGGGDVLLGGDGNDHLHGGYGNDYLQGGRGNDILRGDDQNDRLVGSAGADQMNGGAGADRFIYDQVSMDKSRDVIEGFSRAQGDKIDLSAVDANTNPTAAGNQAFAFIGSNAFSGAAGELRLFVNAAGQQVAAGDVNGDKIADFSILFTSPAAPIGQADFVI
ncbi:MAG: M10 family metallopeptidase C-terminal domain-containing protein [Pseudomonadota bacterium]|nr:M10 family metallopeptidase C-terminal domain-containing protein [Pseudomonadota bacterium]